MSLLILQLLDEFEDIVKKDNLCDLFSVAWETWAPKIVAYAESSQKSGTKDYISLLQSSSVSQGTPYAVLVITCVYTCVHVHVCVCIAVRATSEQSFSHIAQTDVVVSLVLIKLLISRPKNASDFFFLYLKVSHITKLIIVHVCIYILCCTSTCACACVCVHACTVMYCVVSVHVYVCTCLTLTILYTLYICMHSPIEICILS